VDFLERPVAMCVCVYQLIFSNGDKEIMENKSLKLLIGTEIFL
jgi:hypothetical protein